MNNLDKRVSAILLAALRSGASIKTGCNGAGVFGDNVDLIGFAERIEEMLKEQSRDGWVSQTEE